MMTAEIITIGDELLIGQVVNTNQAHIAQRLNEAGVVVKGMTTVGDNLEAIVGALKEAFASQDVVIVTGGLGPTHDDITRDAVCTFFKTDLDFHPPALENIQRLFEYRGIPLTRINRDQALVPRGCEVIPNSLGTAPGYLFHRDGHTMAVLPGVPYEMQTMMQETVVPFLEKQNPGQVVRHRTIKTTGIAESILAEQLGDIEALVPSSESLTLAFLPSPAGVRLRITAVAPDAETARRRIAASEERIRAKASKYIYGVDDEDLEQVVGALLQERGWTLAVAESCTGGLILDRLTNVPGSSAYVERGYVTYSNAAKVRDLQVPATLIEKHGAVSKEVAIAMAEGARKAAGTTFGLSTTGIAGPSGATPDKPVGLVYVGYADAEASLAVRFTLGEGRRRVKERAAQAALELLRKKLLKD
ncbi:MAG: competence/damage-inducible protein A [Bacteroidota bacterium]